MSSGSRTVSHAHVISVAITSLNEFSESGRSSVIVATCSSTSNVIVVQSIIRQPCPRRQRVRHAAVAWRACRPRCAADRRGSGSPAAACSSRGGPCRTRGARRRGRPPSSPEPNAVGSTTATIDSPQSGSGMPITADVGDAGMFEQRRLDLGRVDVGAAGDDHVLGAVGDEQVAVGVEVADVAEAEPLALERGSVCSGSSW